MRGATHTIGISAVAATAALLAVGIISGEIARHVLQTLPLWPAVVLGFAGSPKAKWAGLPVFLFWLAIMALIWAYLLHLSSIASGTYSFAEIAMTVAVGIASIVGLGAGASIQGIRLSGVLAGALLFFTQIGCMAVSLHAPFENDRMFLDWMIR